MNYLNNIYRLSAVLSYMLCSLNVYFDLIKKWKALIKLKEELFMTVHVYT